MTKKHHHKLKFIGTLLVLVMVMGLIPASAKSSKSSEIVTVTVTSKKELVDHLNTDVEEKIIFQTDEAVSLAIPASEYSSKKYLIIKAPNASVTNAAGFTSISVEAVKKYTEKASGNKITVTAENSKITVASKKKVAKLMIDANKVDISANKKSTIKNLTVSHKDGSNITLEATSKAKVKVNLTKKTSLTVVGEKSANVDIKSTYKNNTIEASIPVDVTTTKAINLTLDEGAAGSTVDKSKSNVEVSVTNNSSEDPVVTVKGEPENPGNNPDQPDQPDNPGNNPDQPDNPDNPGNNPDQPDNPDQYPNKDKKEGCPVCWGTGVCERCDGTGLVFCLRCQGSGKTSILCWKCQGTGKDGNGNPCEECGGSGNHGEEECPDCHGSGSCTCEQCEGSKKCPACHGTGLKTD